jgi:hypothetical protein
VLDNLGAPHIGVVWVTANFAKGASLAQQIPTLIEGDLQALESVSVGLSVIPGRLSIPKLVLLSNQFLDGLMNLRVVHFHPPRDGRQGYAILGRRG